jgi:hypothetical protein
MRHSSPGKPIGTCGERREGVVVSTCMQRHATLEPGQAHRHLRDPDAISTQSRRNLDATSTQSRRNLDAISRHFEAIRGQKG